MDTQTINDRDRGDVWYFAYGSNMLPSTMEKRGIELLDAKNVTIPGYFLTFDVFGVPYTEPAMAGISTSSFDSEAPNVHGVLYLLSQRSFKRLVVSEGAGIGYREITVEASVLDLPHRPAYSTEAGRKQQGVTIHAKTLIPRYPFRPNPLPSERYLGSKFSHRPIWPLLLIIVDRGCLLLAQLSGACQMNISNISSLCRLIGKSP